MPYFLMHTKKPEIRERGESWHIGGKTHSLTPWLKVSTASYLANHTEPVVSFALAQFIDCGRRDAG